MLLKTITGKDNLQSGSTAFYVFHAPSSRHPGASQLLSQAAKNNNPEVPIHMGRTRKIAAGAGLPEAMGVWWETQWEVPDGLVLRLWASKSTQGHTRHANTWIRLREGAPMRRCAVPTSPHAGVAFTEVLVEGRFDYLSLNELKMLGVNPDDRSVMSGTPDKVRNMFKDSVLAPEVAPRVIVKAKVVETADGEQVKVPRLIRKRAVKL